ncbi:MAG: hypothetical protein SOW44_08720 [Porphyromonas sp.]|nr:hypothetical protein [Bacteroidales bacterium]MDY3101402.1 hypothetical protein [Porphyromonas sp.]
MESLITQIKATLVALVAIVLSTLAPTGNALFLLVIFAVVNLFIGYQSNLIVRKERFIFRKMWRAIQELAFYMMLTVVMHLCFYLFDETNLALIAVRVVCWVGIWGYLVKILANMLEVFPKSKGIRLLHYIVGIKFIPYILKRVGVEFSEEDMEQFYDGTEGRKKSL